MFSDYDTSQVGSLDFEDFDNLNNFVEVFIGKKDLRKVFDIIDKNKAKKIRLDELRNILSFTVAPEEEVGDQEDEEEANLKGPEIMLRQQVKDIYDDMKNKIETKNTTLEQIILNELGFDPNSLATVQGLKVSLEKLQVIVTKNEAERILKDVRHSCYNKFAVTYKDLIDYMTKKRVNVQFEQKGFVDPLLAASCSQIEQVKNQYGLTLERIFNIFDARKAGWVNKEDFCTSLQGMELDLSAQDILELFNHIDVDGSNKISKTMFVDAVTYVLSRMGGPSVLEKSLNKGTT